MNPQRKAPRKRPQPSCDALETLLAKRNRHPHQQRAIDQLIRKRFEVRRAVLILDMAGFSFSVRRFGIIHHLAKIHRMQEVVGKAVLDCGGTVAKFEADNCFATFASVPAALNTAVRINSDLSALNSQMPKAESIEVAIGIGFGRILLGCDDLFGDEVNLASKLGEDIAGSGEVLLTQKARETLRSRRYRFEPLNMSMSGVRIRASRLVSGLFPA